MMLARSRGEVGEPGQLICGQLNSVTADVLLKT